MFPKEVRLDEKGMERLSKLYQEAYAQIVAEIEGATSFGVANRRAILNQITAILKSLGSDVNEFIEKEIPQYYQEGQTQAEDQLNKVGAEFNTSAQFNRIHKEAIASLVDDTQESFLTSLTGVKRSAQLIINQAVKDQITQQIAIGKIGGKALREIKNNVTGILKNQGLSALVDKSGRSWELDRYSEMLIRTKAVEARNRGLANSVAQNGYDLVQVSSHGASDNCGDWEGKILSVNGLTKGYPTVAQAQEGGLFHPNCKHAINVIIPELAKISKSYDPKLQTLTHQELSKLTLQAI